MWLFTILLLCSVSPFAVIFYMPAIDLKHKTFLSKIFFLHFSDLFYFSFHATRTNRWWYMPIVWFWIHWQKLRNRFGGFVGSSCLRLYCFVCCFILFGSIFHRSVSATSFFIVYKVSTPLFLKYTHFHPILITPLCLSPRKLTSFEAHHQNFNRDGKNHD